MFYLCGKLRNMIQRIQSVYLFLVTVLMSFMIILPLASLSLRDGQSVVFYSYGINKYITRENAEMINRTLPILLLVCLTGLISFVNIFQFGKRVIQMRICLPRARVGECPAGPRTRRPAGPLPSRTSGRPRRRPCACRSASRTP